MRGKERLNAPDTVMDGTGLKGSYDFTLNVDDPSFSTGFHTRRHGRNQRGRGFQVHRENLSPILIGDFVQAGRNRAKPRC
jgi:hypothetical protein